MLSLQYHSAASTVELQSRSLLASLFLLIFWILFWAHNEADCCQTLKSLAAEWSFWRSFGLLLDFYLRGLFWLLAGLHLVGSQDLLHAKYILEALASRPALRPASRLAFILKSTPRGLKVCLEACLEA